MSYIPIWFASLMKWYNNPITKSYLSVIICSHYLIFLVNDNLIEDFVAIMLLIHKTHLNAIINIKHVSAFKTI